MHPARRPGWLGRPHTLESVERRPPPTPFFVVYRRFLRVVFRPLSNNFLFLLSAGFPKGLSVSSTSSPHSSSSLPSSSSSMPKNWLITTHFFFFFWRPLRTGVYERVVSVALARSFPPLLYGVDVKNQSVWRAAHLPRKIPQFIQERAALHKNL